MDKVKSLIDGNKMYITAVVMGLIAAAQYLGYEIPGWIFTVLGAFGIYATKSAIVKSGPGA